MCGGVAGIPEAPTAGQVAIAVAAVASIPWERKDERHSRRERSPKPIHEFASSRAPGDHCSSGSDSSHQGEFVSSLKSHRRGSKSRELAGAFPRRWAWRVLRSEGGRYGCRQRTARRLRKTINFLLLNCKPTNKKLTVDVFLDRAKRVTAATAGARSVRRRAVGDLGRFVSGRVRNTLLSSRIACGRSGKARKGGFMVVVRSAGRSDGGGGGGGGRHGGRKKSEAEGSFDSFLYWSGMILVS